MMFTKQQVETIASCLHFMADSHRELIDMYKLDSKRLPEDKLQQLYGDDHAGLLVGTPAKTQSILDALDTAKKLLSNLRHRGTVYIDIPKRDSDSFENVAVLKSTASAIQYARDTFGSNDFGYLNLLTLGENE